MKHLGLLRNLTGRCLVSVVSLGALLGAALGSTSCGKQGEEETTEVREGGSGNKRVTLGSRTFTSRELSTAERVAAGGGASGSGGGGTADWGTFTAGPTPTPWEPRAVWKALDTHCFECHFNWRELDSSLLRRDESGRYVYIEPMRRRILADNLRSRENPMPPAGRVPDYRTFKTTPDGLVLLAWLDAKAAEPLPGTQPPAASSPTPTVDPTLPSTPTPTPTATPSESAYTWTADIQAIVNASCVTGCHSSAGGSSKADMPFQTREQVKEEKIAIDYAVTQGTMPKASRSISPTDKAKLLDYVRYSSEMR